MAYATTKALFLTGVCAALAACGGGGNGGDNGGGGGGGGGGVTPTPQSLVEIEARTSGLTIEVPAMTASASFNATGVSDPALEGLNQLSANFPSGNDNRFAYQPQVGMAYRARSLDTAVDGSSPYSFDGGATIATTNTPPSIVGPVLGHPGFTLYRPNNANVSGGYSRLVRAVPSNSGLRYTEFGAWVHEYDRYFAVGAQAGGIRTPASLVPTAGSVTYSGATIAELAFPGANQNSVYEIYGDAQLTANFGTGAIAGRMSNLVAEPLNPAQADQNLADIVLNGQIANPRSIFAGTASMGAAPGGLVAAMNGQFSGGFFGQNADAASEVGGIYELSNPGASIVGSFGAKR